MRELKKNCQIVFKGFCMGVADVIPGVSGGTVAFLTGIYEELIGSISSFDRKFFLLLIRGRVAEAVSGTGWKFLALLLTGILTAVFSLSHLLKWLMEEQTVFVLSFFFGLVLTTVFVIARAVRRPDFAKLALGLVSALMMFKIAGMLPVQTPETWWFVFLSGAVAICAMILPGISGAFILLLFGKYDYVITAVAERNFGVLALVGSGCAVGLLTFVHALRWLLNRYHDLTLSVLAGLVLGSLRRIWPWRETLSTMISSRGKIVPLEQVNVFPKAMTSEVVWVILLFIAGVCLSLWLASCDNGEKKTVNPPA